MEREAAADTRHEWARSPARGEHDLTSPTTGGVTALQTTSRWRCSSRRAVCEEKVTTIVCSPDFRWSSPSPQDLVVRRALAGTRATSRLGTSCFPWRAR